MAPQVIRAVYRDVPALVLIRKPDQAIASLLVRDPSMTVESAFKWYLKFYQLLLNYRDKFITATFDELINDYAEVIQRLNAKFETQFVAPAFCDEDLERIFEKIEQIEPEPNKACFPSQIRRQEKAKALARVNSSSYKELLSEAQKLYEVFVSNES